MPVRAHPRMLKRVNRRVKPLRRSPGLRSRLRKSLTTPCSWMRSLMRECSRRSQRSCALPEPFFARSSRLVDQLPEPSSRICTRRISSSQLVSNTLHSTSIKDLLPRQLLKKLPKRLTLKTRRRSEGSKQITFII